MNILTMFEKLLDTQAEYVAFAMTEELNIIAVEPTTRDVYLNKNKY